MILRINWREAHHLYIGILLAITGPVMFGIGRWPDWAGFLVGMIGLLLAWDDIYQHWRQVQQQDYESPCNRLFHWLWRKVWGKNADAIWQRIFG